MAADTATRRLSAMNPMSPWRQTLPIPDAAVSAEDRRHLLFLYALAVAAIAFDPTVEILRGLDTEAARTLLRGYDSEASRHYLTGRDIEAAPPVLRGRV